MQHKKKRNTLMATVLHLRMQAKEVTPGPRSLRLTSFLRFCSWRRVIVLTGLSSACTALMSCKDCVRLRISEPVCLTCLANAGSQCEYCLCYVGCMSVA